MTSETTPDGETITLDLSNIFAGESATLIFRLVNNDSDTGSSVRILGVGTPGDDDPPEVTVDLENDTAPEGLGSEPYRVDRLTNDPTVFGTATDDLKVVLLEAQIDDGGFTDITGALAGGEFRYDPGPLAAGPHAVTIRATDAVGQTAETTTQFSVNAPPVANAGGDRTIGEGATISFDGAASSDSEAPIFAYQWTLSDGSTVDGVTASQHFAQDTISPFQVSLTVTDTAGATHTNTIDVTVENLPPVVDPVEDKESNEVDSLSFSTTFSDLGVLDSHTAVIDWGDGAVEDADVVEQDGAGTVSGAHVYLDDGLYDVTITVTDDGGLADQASFKVLVHNLAPTVLSASDLTGAEGQTLDFLGTFGDPGMLDTHTATIYWSDGTTSPGEVNELNGIGIVTATHVFADNGGYPLSLEVTDNAGAVGDHPATATISNVPPTVTPAQGTTVEEGVSLAMTVATFADPGFDNPSLSDPAKATWEYCTATIDWGDGTIDGTELGTAGLTETPGAAGVPTTGSVFGSHTYADDGQYTVTVSVTDDDGGQGVGTFVVQVENVAPYVTVDPAQQTIQYSDPIAPILITATDVEADPLAATTWYSQNGGPLTEGLPNGLIFSGAGSDGVGSWTISGIADVEPAQYVVRINVDDGDGGITQTDVTVNVAQENAAITYSGVPFVSTQSINHSDATIVLRAIIQDITAVDPVGDPDAGDIRHATVTFVHRETGSVIASDLPVSLLDEADTKTGIVSHEWTVDLGQKDSQSYTIGIIVDGYYTADSAADDTVLTVSKPLDNFITGGGHFVNQESAGQNAGDPGLRTNFGFNVKFNKQLTNLQGHVNVIVRQDGHVYQIKSNATTSLVVDPYTNHAVFTAKANLRDVTDPNNVISLGGGHILEMTITDRGEPGLFDSIGITLWTKDSELLYSSRMVGLTTAEQTIDGGNLVVHKERGFEIATKFFVVDSDTDGVFRYADDGSENGAFSLDSLVTEPRGATSNAAGDTVWVIDATTQKVFVSSPSGLVRGAWVAEGLDNPQGIATDGTDIWIVDAAAGTIAQYGGAAALTAGVAVVGASFVLHPDNTSPTGIATDGGTLWVSDDVADQVFVYDTAGALLGRWSLDAENSDPSGITDDPTGGTDLWVVDRQDLLVYHYDTGATLPEGVETAAGTFALAAANVSPEGIADPPVTDPNDPRSWLGATVGTFARLYFGSDTLENRQAVVDAQLLDDGPFDPTNSFATTMLPTPWALGTGGSGSHRAGNARGESFDTTGTGSFGYRIRGDLDVFTAGNAIDRLWFQSSGSVGNTVFDLGIPASKAAVFNTIDHGPLPQEAIESTVYLSNDLVNWTQAVVERVWLEGYEANLGIKWDGFVYAVGTGNEETFRYASTTWGGPGALIADGDDEINGILGLNADFTPVTPDPPAVFIQSPAENADFAAGSTILVSGQALADSRVASITHVLIDGMSVDSLDASGNFFTQVLVAPGQNNYEFVATDSLGQTAGATLTLTGAQPTPGEIDFSLFSDVTASLEGGYGRTSFNENSDVLYAGMAVHNAGQYPADTPLIVGITNLSDPTVRVREPDGLTPEGIPYYNFTDLVPGGTLQPGELTDQRTLAFFNPQRIQFSYDLVFLGLLNQAPAITTVPLVAAIAGRPYRYDADAVDPDAAPLTFSLLSGPADATVDPATGEILWSPDSGDLGNHAVALRVEDGRGGSTEQHYTLSATAAPPNRPPYFTSVPVVDAQVNQPYTYDADAVDPDGDALEFTGPPPLISNIEVRNPSFEAQPLGENGWIDWNLTDWTVSGSGGPWNPTTATYPDGSVPDGQNVAWSNGGTIYQVLDASLSANTQYSLQVDIGHRLDTSFPGYAIQLWAGASLLAEESSLSPGSGTFATSIVEYSASADDLLLGERLEIRLVSLGLQVNFDNVRLLLLTDQDYPDGTSLNPGAGLFNWIPTSDQVGTHNIAIDVSDGRGGSATQSYTVQVHPDPDNHPPLIVSDPVTTAVIESPYEYHVAALDADGDQLKFKLLESPPDVVINAETGEVTWPVPELGSAQVALEVTDGRGGRDTQSFTICVGTADGVVIMGSGDGTHGFSPLPTSNSAVLLNTASSRSFPNPFVPSPLAVLVPIRHLSTVIRSVIRPHSVSAGFTGRNLTSRVN